MNNYIKNATALVIGCLFAILLLFVSVILFAKSGIILKGSQISSISSLKEDPLVGYTYTPNMNLNYEDENGERAIQINNMGFRSHDYNQKDIKSGKQRIIVLGDSFTIGLGARMTFSDLLENMLNNNGKKPVLVYNFGMPGYSSHNELGVLQKYGEDIRPKVVIVTFYLGNDFRDNLIPLSNLKIISGYLVNNVFTWADKKIILNDEELAKYVDIATEYKLTGYSMIQMIRVDKFGAQMTFIEKTVRQLSISFPGIKSFTDYFKQKIPLGMLLSLNITVPEYYKVSDEEIKTTEVYLKEIRDESHKLNATLILAIIPEHLSNDENLSKRQTIKQICERLGVSHVIDLFDYLKDDMDNYYLKSDDHLSQAGHSVVANGIVTYIHKHNLLEKSSLN